MLKGLDREAKGMLIALLAFTLFFRLATLMMIHTGEDERDYWNSARALARGLPYPEISHRTTRFAIILPVALSQLAFGIHPNAYYAMPLLNCLAQVALAFLIGLRLRGRIAGFVAGLCLALFPYMIRAGSQIRPEVFSITYILLASLAFIEYLGRDDRSLPFLLWTTAFLFAAYEAKITNLFFVPGMLLAILLYKKKPSHALVLGGGLLLLFLAETGAYALFTRYKYGELEIILQNHFHPDSLVVPHLSSLLERYSSEHLQAYWRIPFALFAIASIVFLSKGRDPRIRGLILASLSFFFFLTIEVKSLHPIMPAESFINRYFSAVLGPAFLVLGCACEGIIVRLFPQAGKLLEERSGRLAATLLSSGALIVLVLFSLPGLPPSIRPYANSPLRLREHPLALNEGYRRQVNGAFNEGTPIVASKGLGGFNALSTCSYFYLDLSNYRDGRPPEFSAAGYGSKELLVLSKDGAGLSSASSCLVALRTPFRVIPMKADGLAALSDDSLVEENK